MYSTHLQMYALGTLLCVSTCAIIHHTDMAIRERRNGTKLFYDVCESFNDLQKLHWLSLVQTYSILERYIVQLYGPSVNTKYMIRTAFSLHTRKVDIQASLHAKGTSPVSSIRTYSTKRN